MLRRPIRLAPLALSLACLLAGPAPANAQSAADKIAAEALFKEGRTLMGKGELAKACGKFAASHKLDPSVGALLSGGECESRRGRTATAWLYYNEAASLASQRGDRSRAGIANQRADALKPKLTYLTIEVAADARVDGLVVKNNGRGIPSAAWGQPLPVDPGTFKIEASAPGFKTKTWDVRAVGQGNTVTASVSKLEAAAVTDPVKTPPDNPVEPIKDPPRDPVVGNPGTPPIDRGADSGLSGRKTVALMFGGAALATAGVSTVLLVLAKRQNPDNCAEKPGGCDDGDIEANESARRKGNVATITAISAVAFAGVATYLWISDDGNSSRGTALAPAVTGDSVGVFAVGRF